MVFLEARNKKIFHGADVGNDKIPICHLQFADDALIIGQWSVGHLPILRTCLEFSRASILRPGLRLTSTKVSFLELEFLLMILTPWLIPLDANLPNFLAFTWDFPLVLI